MSLDIPKTNPHIHQQKKKQQLTCRMLHINLIYTLPPFITVSLSESPQKKNPSYPPELMLCGHPRNNSAMEPFTQP